MVGDMLTIQRFSPPLREFIDTNPEFFSSPETSVEVLELPAGEDCGNHYAIYRDLEAAIAEGRPPYCTGREGLLSLELANAITLSSFNGQPVTLPVNRSAYSALLNDLKARAR